MTLFSKPPETVCTKPSAEGGPTGNTWSEILFARLLIGFIVLICAEVFSGASLHVGLWHPWTLLVTYWLYFAHFFFFTTLAVRTGRTSLSALYLWGVLFGLYESWITKVIWSGFSGDGKLAMGRLGPYGFAEISMVFIFHPVMSFILPLLVTCLLWPPLRNLFPELAWFTQKSKGARLVQAYLILSFAPIMAMNGNGTLNLAVNLAFAILSLFILARFARSALAASDGRRIVAFGRRGFGGLCVYLVLLYGLTYAYMRPKALPSVPVQLLTFVFYALALAGLWMHRHREPLPNATAPCAKPELQRIKTLFARLLALALLCSLVVGHSALFRPIVLNFVLWTLMSFVLTGLALAKGVREYRQVV